MTLIVLNGARTELRQAYARRLAAIEKFKRTQLAELDKEIQELEALICKLQADNHGTELKKSQWTPERRAKQSAFMKKRKPTKITSAGRKKLSATMVARRARDKAERGLL